MEILIGIASWSFVALFLSTRLILPGWVANGAKKEGLKDALTMIAMLFFYLALLCWLKYFSLRAEKDLI